MKKLTMEFIINSSYCTVMVSLIHLYIFCGEGDVIYICHKTTTLFLEALKNKQRI